MKCSKCGHRCNTIAAMSKHYRQKHPAAMKRKAPRSKAPKESVRAIVRDELRRMGY